MLERCPTCGSDNPAEHVIMRGIAKIQVPREEVCNARALCRNSFHVIHKVIIESKPDERSVIVYLSSGPGVQTELAYANYDTHGWAARAC